MATPILVGSGPYIPAKLADYAVWSQNFTDLIYADPIRYGLSNSDKVTLAGVNDTFQAAYVLSTAPSTRTPATVAATNSAAISAKQIQRTFASQIRIDPSVTNDDKLALGLRLPNAAPSPIPAPTTFPLLTFLSGTPLAQQWSYKDSDTAVGKAKAPGAIQMELRGQTSATPITDPEQLHPLAVQTKSPFLITWDAADGGKLAYLAGRWVTRTGLVGPWSSIKTATVPAA